MLPLVLAVINWTFSNKIHVLESFRPSIHHTIPLLVLPRTKIPATVFREKALEMEAVFRPEVFRIFFQWIPIKEKLLYYFTINVNVTFRSILSLPSFLIPYLSWVIEWCVYRWSETMIVKCPQTKLTMIVSNNLLIKFFSSINLSESITVLHRVIYYLLIHFELVDAFDLQICSRLFVRRKFSSSSPNANTITRNYLIENHIIFFSIGSSSGKRT
jgi:hypothetical protein